MKKIFIACLFTLLSFTFANAEEDAIYASYKEKIFALITSNVEYPRIARRNEWEGQVTLKFDIFKDGYLEPRSMKILEDLEYAEGRHIYVNFDIFIDKSSGYLSLDKAAVLAVGKSLPFPKFPNELEDNSITFIVPINFTLREKK